jgi:D-alanyl-D-alanine dipeptidase
MKMIEKQKSRRPHIQMLQNNFRHAVTIILLAMIAGNSGNAAEGVPRGFVYLREVDPTIRQDMRYAGSHNFVGRPIDGYRAAECILTEQAATALKRVQTDLMARQLSLIVWDCYRPARAVRDFLRWTATSDQRMKDEFFPRTDKARLFSLGYLAKRSRHSRGSTVDLGIVPAGVKENFQSAAPSSLASCFAPKGVRFEDGTIDFGTGYDCLDSVADVRTKEVGKLARHNRLYLRQLMVLAGFQPYDKEWWHFELNNEPFRSEFDFEILPSRPSE